MSADVEKAMVSNTAAWWDTKREHVHDGLMTLDEAWATGVLDWEVELVPIEFNGQETGYNLVVRDIDDAVFAAVGSSYTPLQNRQVADFLNDVCNEGDLGVESILSLKGGKVIAICARFPESMTIAGEEYVDYITAANWHSATNAARFYASSVRTVCRNTLEMGLSTAQNVYTIRHVGDLSGRVQEARDMLGMACKWQAALKKTGEALAARRISGKELDAFLTKLVPDANGKKAEVQQQAVIRTRDGIKSVYRDSPDLENIRGTRWGVMQAVVEHQDHHRNFRTDDNRFVSMIERSNLNQQAFDLLRR